MLSRIPKENVISTENEPLDSVILDAELVPFSEKYQKVDEFYRLSDLLSSGRDSKPVACVQEVDLDQSSERSTASYREYTRYYRHLAIVFFDILYINGRSTLHLEWNGRREKLVKRIRLVPGFVRALLSCLMISLLILHYLEHFDPR